MPQKKLASPPDVSGFGPPEDTVQGFGPPEDTSQPPDLQDHAPIPQPGFLSRLRESLGVPDFQTMMHNASYGTAEAAHGIEPPSVVTQYGNNLIQSGKQMMDTIHANPGDSGKAVEAGTKFLTGGVLSPFGGQTLSSLSDDLQGHNFAAAGGDILGLTANILALEKSMKPSAETQLNKLTAAAGPKAAKALGSTIDILNQTKEAEQMPVKTVGDLKKLVNKTKDNINTEYGNSLGPFANTKIAAHPIAQAIRSLITPDMDFTREGQAEKAAINAAATEYEKPWTMAALDSKRSRLSADLASHTSKEPVSRYTAERGNINVAIDNKILQTLRDEIYPRVDVMAGKPSGYFENLKKKQSGLIQLESILNKRIDDLTGKTRAAKGAPALSRLSGGISVSPDMSPHGYLSKFLNVIRPEDVLGTANTVTKSGMKGPNPVAKGLVLSYPARALSTNQPNPWWDHPQ